MDAVSGGGGLEFLNDFAGWVGTTAGRAYAAFLNDTDDLINYVGFAGCVVRGGGGYCA